MAKTHQITQKKGRSPYTMLLLTALLLPCANNLLLGTLMLVTYYFGNFYAYTPGGTVLTVLYEIVSSLFAIIKHCSLIMTLMTIGSCVFRKGAAKGFLCALFAAAMSVGEVVASVLSLVLTVSLGISDSTLALPNQLLGLLPVSVLRIGSAFVICLLAAAVYLAAKFFSKKKTAGASPFIVTTLVMVAVYTCYLYVDPITVVLTPAEGGNILNNYILPLVYPLLYGGFMVLTALKFPDVLSAYYANRFLSTGGKKEKK